MGFRENMAQVCQSMNLLADILLEWKTVTTISGQEFGFPS
jgi:hypothetical protein